MTDYGARLAALAERQRYRRRRTLETAQGPEIRLDGRRLIGFCSNDYLGLAADPRLAEAMTAGVKRWGVGSGAAHLVNGHSAAHEALEQELAAFTGRPRALLFSTGYMANLGLGVAFAGRGDSVLEDRLNHASLIDAGRLSGARLLRYRHADAADLDARLAGRASGNRLVLSDGVFSMDGDVAPVAALAEVCARRDALLAIDDAHGLGVLGASGGGCLQADRLGVAQVPLLMGTLGKALGTAGAFVAGPEPLIEWLIQSARTYIFTTAQPPAVAEATRAALRIVAEEHWRRERLQALVTRLRREVAALGLPLMDSPTPIQPLLVGADADAVRLSEALLNRGILVSAIRPPTVPEGSARLRITLTAAHSDLQLERLLDALASLRDQWPSTPGC